MQHPLPIDAQDRDLLEHELEKRIRSVKFRKLGNEPNYNPALIQALEDFHFSGKNFSLTIGGAVMESVGKDTAESKTGADMSISADIRYGLELKQKAVLVQAKRRSSFRKPGEWKRLLGQIDKMKQISEHPKVMIIDDEEGGLPIIKSGVGILEDANAQEITLSSWLARRFARTFDGDTKPEVYKAAQSSNLDRIWLNVKF